MSSPAAAAAAGSGSADAAAAATPTTLRKPVRNFRHALTGLDPAAVLPAVAAYPCPMVRRSAHCRQRAERRSIALQPRHLFVRLTLVPNVCACVACLCSATSPLSTASAR